jgi:hypothetical protein
MLGIDPLSFGFVPGISIILFVYLHVYNDFYGFE